MSEERVTSHPADSAGTTHTTVIREGGSSGTGIIIAVVLLIAVVAGIYLFSQNSASENAKNNAIADAASNVSSEGCAFMNMNAG